MDARREEISQLDARSGGYQFGRRRSGNLSGPSSIEQPFADSQLVIDEILAGDGLSLAQGAKLFPPARVGRPVNPSCLHRWATDGAKGPGGTIVKLEVCRIGCRLSTSRGAIRRFLLAMNQSAGDVQRQPTVQSRKRDRVRRHLLPEQVAEELRQLGV